MKLRSTFAVLAMCAAGAYAADIFTVVKWNRLITHSGTGGSPMTTYPNETLPTGWGVWVENNEGNVQVIASASRKKNQAGVTTRDYFGKSEFLVNVLTDKTTNPKFLLTAIHTGVATASVQIEFYNAMAYARASTSFPDLKTRELKAHAGNNSEEETKGLASIKKGWTMTGQTWIDIGGGVSETNVVLPTGLIAGKGVATSPGGGGNQMASIGVGSATEKLKVVALKMSSGSGNAGIISGTRASYIDHLQIEVRNQYNALLDLWSVGGVPVDWDLPFDGYADGTYRLICWAPGSLRKRIDVTYTASAGVTGVDASLYMGDIDSNNSVTQAELDAITTYTGRTWLDEGWRDEIPGLGCRIMDCDLNQDNQVTATDYLLAVGNLGRVGD